MNNYHIKRLELSCYGYNEARRLAEKEINHIRPQLEKLVGKKVVTAQGSHAKTMDTIVFLKGTPIPYQGGFATWSLYLNVSSYSMWLKTQLCLNGGSYNNKTNYCQYFEDQFYMGDVKDQILTNMSSDEQCFVYEEPITPEDQMNLIDTYNEYKQKARDIKRKIKVCDDLLDTRS